MKVPILLNPAPLGEVIAASTTAFTAQCIQVPRSDTVTALPDPPPFGAFVRVGGESTSAKEGLPHPPDFDPFEDVPLSSALLPVENDSTAAAAMVIYGVVVYAETGALEAGRPLTAFGLSEEELQSQQPHLYELLATRFTAALIAHSYDLSSQGAIRAYLPPRPPRPHARVFLATDAETRQLTAKLDFLRTLLTGGAAGGAAFPPDELVAALLRNAWRAHGGDEAFLIRAGRELAALLPTDYDRLRALIARVTG